MRISPAARRGGGDTCRTEGCFCWDGRQPAPHPHTAKGKPGKTACKWRLRTAHGERGLEAGKCRQQPFKLLSPSPLQVRI